MPKGKDNKNILEEKNSIRKDKTDVKEGDTNKTVSIKKAVRKRKKATTKIAPVVHPLEQFGYESKNFIIQHIRTIDYMDMADLLGIKKEDLKSAVEKMGIQLPIARANKWADINIGKFRSLEYCARCQVQHNHRSFFVGVKNCHNCLKRNIKHWLDKKVHIVIHFPVE